jgi:hypothetical protein
MIKFFRKIRQRLLSENKFTKYLIYALGEIVLVVIGILIALQINNWNETQKLRRLEISLLEEMKSNLLSDITDMEENIRYNESAIRSAHVILTSFAHQLPQNDSLKKHYGKVAIVPRYLSTLNSYNSMNNHGIRMVSNDSLRKAITDHYQRNNEYIIRWNESEWNSMFTDQQLINRKFFSSYRYIGEVEPTDYKMLSTSTEYKNYLNNRIGILSASNWYYMNYGIAGAQNLIDLIDNELAERRP